MTLRRFVLECRNLHHFRISLYALTIFWSLSTVADGNRIEHHALTVNINPEANSLTATDVIQIRGGEPELLLYLGSTFTWKEMRQGDRVLRWEKVAEGAGGKGARYRVEGWSPNNQPLVASWQGTLAEFRGYRVSIIRADLVELSGFSGWFPTIETSSQAELFTYTMKLNMPDDWVVLSPRDGEFKPDTGGRMDFIHQTSQTQDIFICASPDFHRYQIGSEDSRVLLYSLPRKDLEPIVTDFESVVSLNTEWFGIPVTSRTIVAIISPRRGGAEWGYERGPFWVTGDGFANYLLEHDWESQGLKKSLAAHETIHTWFGKSLGFEQAWLMEALTQYLEVIITARLYGQADLPDRYFTWYQERFANSKAGIDVPVSQLAIDENHYDHWYLKGSWAFWDLEALAGREALIEAFSTVYKERSGSTISSADFIKLLEKSLKTDLGPFFAHWFDQPGFEPLYRGKTGIMGSAVKGAE